MKRKIILLIMVTVLYTCMYGATDNFFTNLTGGAGNSKTWVLDVTKIVTETVSDAGDTTTTESYVSQYFHNPLDFYGDEEAGGASDNIWGPWGGTNIVDWGGTLEDGEITFYGTDTNAVLTIGDYKDSVKFSINTYERDADFLTLTEGRTLWQYMLEESYYYLGELSDSMADIVFPDSMRFPLDSTRITNDGNETYPNQFLEEDLQNVKIIHCSDSALIVRVKRTYDGDDENTCWLLYNYIVKGYDYGTQEVLTHTVNTSVQQEDLIGTWQLALPYYDWIGWESLEPLNGWTTEEEMINTGWAATEESIAEDSQLQITFKEDGSCDIDGQTTTYEVINGGGYIQFGDSVYLATYMPVLEGYNIYVPTVTGSTEGLWLGQNNGTKEETEALYFEKVEESGSNDSLLYANLTGGKGNSKTWVLDIVEVVTESIDDAGNTTTTTSYLSEYFHNPLDFYGDDTISGGPWAPWGGTNIYDWGSYPEGGEITFYGDDTTAMLTISEKIDSAEFSISIYDRPDDYCMFPSSETTFDVDTNLWAVMLDGQYDYLTGLSASMADISFTGDVRFPIDSVRLVNDNDETYPSQFLPQDISNVTIMHCSDSGLIVRIKRTYEGDSENKCWLLYHYTVKDYDYGTIEDVLTHTVNTSVQKEDLIGTWQLALPYYEWIGWESLEPLNGWTTAEEMINTGWAATEESIAEDSQLQITFNEDGSCDIDGQTTTYEVINGGGYIQFADSIYLATYIPVLEGYNIYVPTVTGSTDGLWLGQNNGSKQETEALYFEKVELNSNDSALIEKLTGGFENEKTWVLDIEGVGKYAGPLGFAGTDWDFATEDYDGTGDDEWIWLNPGTDWIFDNNVMELPGDDGYGSMTFSESEGAFLLSADKTKEEDETGAFSVDSDTKTLTTQGVTILRSYKPDAMVIDETSGDTSYVDGKEGFSDWNNYRIFSLTDSALSLAVYRDQDVQDEGVCWIIYHFIETSIYDVLVAENTTTDTGNTASYKDLTGGAGSSKTWVLDIEGVGAYSGALGFLGTDWDFTTGDYDDSGDDAWTWLDPGIDWIFADYPNNVMEFPGDEGYGSMTFSLEDGDTVLSADKILEDSEVGSFFLDTVSMTLTTDGVTIIRSYKPNTYTVDETSGDTTWSDQDGIEGFSDWNTYKVYELTDTSLSLAVLRDQDIEGEGTCWIVYHFIETSVYDKLVGVNPDPEAPIETSIQASDLDGTWCISKVQPIGWISWEQDGADDLYTTWSSFNACVEDIFSWWHFGDPDTEYAATKRDSAALAAKMVNITFDNGSVTINNAVYDEDSSIIVSETYSSTYTLKNGILTFASDVVINGLSIELSGTEMHLLSPDNAETTGGLWLGQQDGDLWQSKTIQFKDTTIVSTLNTLVESSSVTFFPNPFVVNAATEIQLEDAGSIQLQVFNSNGQLVQVFNQSGTKGANTIVLSGDGLSQGMYIYKIISKDKIYSGKIIKQE